jgi:MFS family permease
MAKTENLEVVCLHIVIGGLLFAYNLSVLNTSIENIASSLDWGDNKEIYIIFSNSLVPIGAFTGGLLTGWYSNYGRRFTVQSCDILTIFSSILTLIPLTEVFLSGRFLIGVASGSFLTICPVYVSELTPSNLMSRYGPYIQISTDVGVLLAYLLCLPLPTSDYSDHWLNNWWRFMLGLPGVIALYQLFYFSFIFKHESPEWLLLHGKQAEAVKVFEDLFPEDDPSIYLSMRKNSEEEESERLIREDYGLVALFKIRKYRKPLVLAVGLAIIQQCSGINAAIIYSSYIFQEFGGSVRSSRIYTICSGVVFLVSAASSIVWLNYFGRKTLLIVGQGFLSLVMAGLGLCSFLDWPVGVSVGLLNAFYLFYSFSLGAALWTYLGEVMNEKLMSVSTSVNFFFVCVVAFTFPLVSEEAGIHFYFFFFSVSMIFGIVFTWVYLIETQGMTREEIRKVFYAT